MQQKVRQNRITFKILQISLRKNDLYNRIFIRLLFACRVIYWLSRPRQSHCIYKYIHCTRMVSVWSCFSPPVSHSNRYRFRNAKSQFSLQRQKGKISIAISVFIFIPFLVCSFRAAETRDDCHLVRLQNFVHSIFGNKKS